MNRLASLTAAVTNLRNTSQYFDLTNSLLKDFGAELSHGYRPINVDKYTKNGKVTQYVYIHDGVKQIAEIAGTEVVRGVINKVTDWEEFISTEYDGLVFYQVAEEYRNEKTV